MIAVLVAFLALWSVPAYGECPLGLGNCAITAEQCKQPISLDLDSAGMGEVAALFSKLLATNIILDRGVSGQITTHLTDIPVCEALRVILESKGLYAVGDGRVTIMHRLMQQ